MIHKFSTVDKNQPWFKRLRESLDNRLQKLREINDQPNNDEATSFLRGQIKEIKSLIKDMEK